MANQLPNFLDIFDPQRVVIVGNSFVKRLANDGLQGLIPWNGTFDVTEQAVTFVHTLWDHKIFKIQNMEKESFERDLKEFVGFVDMVVLIIGGNDIANDAYGTVFSTS